MLDLAHAATSEADAAATRACLEMHVRAQEEAATRRDAEQALETERAASTALRRDLDRLRSAFEAECASVAQLRGALDEARAATRGDRETAARAADMVARMQQELDAVQHAATGRIADLEETSDRLKNEAERVRHELEVARHEAGAAEAEALARYAHAHDDADRRVRGLELELEEREREVRKRDERIAALEMAQTSLEKAQHDAAAADAEARAGYERARDEAERRVFELQLELEERIQELRAREEEIAASRIAQTSVPEPAPPLDDRPVRRAPRITFQEAVEVLLDEGEAVLVNLSTVGAQVLSPRALKPNRTMRVQLPGSVSPVVCDGSVVWARLEPADGALMYRAGMMFNDADESAISEFLAQRASN